MQAITSHTLQLILLISILAGPIPLSLKILTIFFPRRGGPYHALLLLLAWWSFLQLGLVMGLGIIAVFTLRGVLIGEAIFFLLGGGLLLRNKPVAHLREWFADPTPLSRLERLVTGFYLMAAVFLLWVTVTNPIADFDSLYYHLTHMAAWYQAGDLERLPGFGPASYYPFAWEALSALFIFPFRSDFFVGFPNWIAWLLSGLAIVVIGSELGADREKSLLAAGLYLYMPWLMQQTGTMMIDLPFSAFFMLGLANLLLFQRTRQPGYLALLIAAGGVLLGIKMSGLGYAGLLAALWAFFEIRRWVLLKKYPPQPAESQAPRLEESAGFQRFFAEAKTRSMCSGGLVLASILLAFASGGYWYLNNWRKTGNPLGILPVQIGNRMIFAGNTELLAFVQKTTLANLFDLQNPENWGVLFNALYDQLGISLIIMVVLAAFLILRRPRTAGRIGGVPIGLFCIGLLMFTWGLYWFTPYSGDNNSHNWTITPWIGQGLRYAFPFFGILAVSSACGATLARFPNTLMAALLAAPLALFFYRTRPDRAAVLIIFGVWVVQHIIRSRPVSLILERRKPLSAIGAVIASAIVLFSISYAAQAVRYQRQAAGYRNIYAFIEESIPREVRIGIAGSFRPYLLYGRHFDRQVSSTPAPADIRRRDWLAGLQADQIGFVALGPVRGEYWNSAPVVQWLMDKNDFKRVFGEDIFTETVIFKLKKQP